MRLTLKKPLERSLRAGHPWIYRDALEVPKGIKTGSSVDVFSRGQFIARGLYDGGSPIAVRVYTLLADQLIDEAFIAQKLERALKARRGVIDPDQTTAFRLLNGEGDDLPGVVVDLYDDIAVVRLDGDAARALRGWVVSALTKLRPSLSTVYERSRGGKGELLFGPAPRNPVEIREHDVRFAVDVVHGQKTGFFLDQRENRNAIGSYARGQDVANLFSYTGGFSVYAALAGARKVVTVDSAQGAIENARINFQLNGLDPEKHEFVCADVFDWLTKETRKFGLMIVDPPSFAPSEKSKGRARSAYRDLNAAALKQVAAGGLLAAASCSSHVGMEDFLGVLSDAGASAKRHLQVLEVRGQPADHPSLPAFPEGRYLKFVLVRAD